MTVLGEVEAGLTRGVVEPGLDPTTLGVRCHEDLLQTEQVLVPGNAFLNVANAEAQVVDATDVGHCTLLADGVWLLWRSSELASNGWVLAGSTGPVYRGPIGSVTEMGRQEGPSLAEVSLM